jgi:translocator protein
MQRDLDRKQAAMFWKSLATTSVLTAAAATAGSLASQDATSRWYRKLRKPPIQPPPLAFPIVWTALYTGIAVTSAKVLSARPGTGQASGAGAGTATDAATPASRASRGFLGALVLNLILNASWSWCFFRFRNLTLSLGVAAALAASSTDLACRAARVRPALGWALAPYAAWCTFATVLTASIRRLNR